MIKNRKRIGKITQILSTILAVVILATTVFTSGVLATAVFEDNSNIHFTCNGKVINFTNKPFYENNTVYLPIRELFEKIGVMDNEDNKIEWDNGKIYVTIVGDTTTHYCVEINNNQLGISHKEPFTNNSQMTMSVSLTTAPAILRNSTTYIPYDFVDYMLHKGMVSNIKNDSPYNITCIVKGETNIAYITPTFTWTSESETISNTFGKRVHPITSEEKIHNGIDISAPENTPVISATYGEVLDTGFDKEFGNYIIIENDNGVKVYYGHLSAVEVAKGDKVKQRAVIGKVGKTGTATGANLHFEIQINGEYYNPELFWTNTQAELINKELPSVVETYEKTPPEQGQEDLGSSEETVINYYYKLDDGSWKSGDYTYKYRLVLTGRLNNAVKDSGYVVLSNTKDITFEQAWKASGLSSNSNDYFNPEEAVIVEIK